MEQIGIHAIGKHNMQAIHRLSNMTGDREAK